MGLDFRQLALCTDFCNYSHTAGRGRDVDLVHSCIDCRVELEHLFDHAKLLMPNAHGSYTEHNYHEISNVHLSIFKHCCAELLLFHRCGLGLRHHTWSTSFH